MFLHELEQPLFDGVYDPHIFKAVFMAGSPGAGKSTIANKLFAPTGLKTLNVDNFWHLYNKIGKPIDYEKHWELYKKQEKNFIAGRLGLLIDGTARNPEKMEEVKNKLEELGYETAMIFVNTRLETSYKRVQQRHQLTGRSVDLEFVEKTWNQVQQNIGRLQNLFGQNFYVVDNESIDTDLTYVNRAMDRWLSKAPSRPIARQWIQSQLGNSKK